MEKPGVLENGLDQGLSNFYMQRNHLGILFKMQEFLCSAVVKDRVVTAMAPVTAVEQI